MAKTWNQLSSTQRRLIVAVGVAEAALKAAMLVDLKRRRPGQVHGPRWLWACSALVNSGGVIPAAYFLFGRAKP